MVLGGPDIGCDVELRRGELRSGPIERCGGGTLFGLREGGGAVELEDAVDGGEIVAIVEHAEAGADDPGGVRGVCEAEAWADVDGVLGEWAGEMVVVVADAVVDGESGGGCPVILRVGCAADFGEVGVGISEGLVVEVRVAGGERGEVAEDVEAAKAVEVMGAKGDVVQADAGLEEVLTALLDDAFAELGVGFEAAVVACEGGAELRDAGDEDAWSGGGGGAVDGAALGEFEAEAVDEAGGEDGAKGAVEAVVVVECGAARAAIGEVVDVEGVVDVAVVGESVAQHEGVVGVEGMVEPGGEFGLLLGGGEEAGLEGERWERADGGDGAVDLRDGGGGEIVGVFAAGVLLLGGDVVEGLVGEERATGGEAGAEADLVGLVGEDFEGWVGVECAVLDEDEGVAVLEAHARAGLDVDGAAGSAAGLGLEAVVDDLEVADGFGGEFGAAGSGVLVIVIDAVDVEGVAVGAEAAEAEAAGALCERLLRDGGVGLCDLRCEKREDEVVAAFDG